MARTIVKSRAVVLRRQRLGETSKLVTLFTEDYGKLKVVAKGARQPRSRFGAALEPFTEVQAVCYLRDDRELQTLSECDVIRQHPGLQADLERLSLASAAGELVDRLTVEAEPNRRIYACLAGALPALAEVAAAQVEPVFWYFQLRVAQALGYQPELSQCVACGGALVGAWLWFGAEAGGTLCSACGQGRGVRLAGDSLRLLGYLQQLPRYTAEAMPPAPARRGEIRAALRHFLEFHGGGRQRLRSLDFLEAVVGLDERDAAPALPNGPETGVGHG